MSIVIVFIMSSVMGFSSSYMIDAVKEQSKSRVFFWEFLGPVLGFFYQRALILEESNWMAFLISVVCGLGYAIGGYLAILKLKK